MRAFIEELIEMRNQVDPAKLDRYESSFRKASKFIVHQGEFIPYELVEDANKGKKHLKALMLKYGKAKVKRSLDKKLSKFYRKHGLKRDIDHIVDSIVYLEIGDSTSLEKNKPKKKETNSRDKVIGQDIASDPMYKQNQLDVLSSYQGTTYSATDEQLKAIGKAFANELVAPTNEWLDKLLTEGYISSPERYWQVAGTFKRRIWGKLQDEDHKDKNVFLCVGIDLETKEVFFGLDCLRTGTSKISAEDIFKFDHFTRGQQTLQSFGALEISSKELIKQSQQFIKKMHPLYHKVIKYIWQDEVDTSETKNKLLPVSAQYSGNLTEKYKAGKKAVQSLRKMVVEFEKQVLEYGGKQHLAKKVRLSPDSHYDVQSYESDGTKKMIKVIGSKTSSINGAEIDHDSIAASREEPDQSYLYIITNLNTKRNSGILYQHHGRFDRILKLAPSVMQIVQ